MSAAEGGYMVMLPLAVPEGMTMTGVTSALLPWNTPRCLAVVGNATADGAPALSIAMEWPIPWIQVVEPMPKSASAASTRGNDHATSHNAKPGASRSPGGAGIAR